jgi:hypothetical protein
MDTSGARIVPPHKQDKVKKVLYISKDNSACFAGLSLDDAIKQVDLTYLQLYHQ